jgi:hypothetical protein
MLFFKLRHLFFEEHAEEEQICQVIRESPIQMVERMLISLTEHYDAKVQEIVEPYREENEHLQS